MVMGGGVATAVFGVRRAWRQAEAMALPGKDLWRRIRRHEENGALKRAAKTESNCRWQALAMEEAAATFSSSGVKSGEQARSLLQKAASRK
jgi:hypothetical protein